MKKLMTRPLLVLALIIFFAVVPKAQAVVAPILPTATPEKAPDDRINWKHGDGDAVLYPRQDDQGNPVLYLYCIDARGNGYLGDIITQAVFDKAPVRPDTNTKVGETDVCRLPVKFYVLTSGEYQVNIGPDAEGNVEAIVFTGLPPANIQYQHLKR